MHKLNELRHALWVLRSVKFYGSLSLVILVPLWFLIISLVVSILVNYYFQVTLYVAKITENNVTKLL